MIDLPDRLEGHLDFSYLMKLPIPQGDYEGLHLKIDLLEERGSLHLTRVWHLLLRLLLFSEHLQELYHLPHTELLASLERVSIQVLRRFKVGVFQLPLLR